LAALPFGQAQTWTDCNPIKTSCPPDRGLKTSTFSTSFASEKGLPPGWVREKSAGNVNFGPSGAEFIMGKKGDSPGLNTDFFFLFGRVDVKMKAAPGVGVISTYVLQSDDLDEIDYVCINEISTYQSKSTDCILRSFSVPNQVRSRPTTLARGTTEHTIVAPNTACKPRESSTRILLTGPIPV
jgi:hypothetical protein